MKKQQITLILLVCLEFIILYKRFETSNEVNQHLFSGLALVILLKILSLTNLTENNHGNQKI
jgi:hypothetical protein